MSLEEFTKAINEAIAQYRSRRHIDHQKAIKALETKIAANIKAFIPKDFKAETKDQDIVILVDGLVSTARSFYAKYRITRWIESVINYAFGKKEAIVTLIENAPKQVTERLGLPLPVAFKDLPPEQRLYVRGQACVAEMAKYDLLDNIADIKKIEKLNDKDLGLLHKFVTLEVSINGRDPSHPKSPDKFDQMIKKDYKFTREEMLEDLNFILEDYKSFQKQDKITTVEIERIKRMKIDGVIATFASEVELSKVKSESVNEIMQIMADKSYSLWIKDIAKDAVASVHPHKPDVKLEAILVAQLKTQQAFITKNITSSAVAKFEKKLKMNLKADYQLGDHEHIGLVSSTLREMYPKTYKSPVEKKKAIERSYQKELASKGYISV